MAGAPFVGKFELTKPDSDNFEAFLKELGVGYIKRKLAKSATPVVTISLEGDTWTIKTVTSIRTSEIKFKLNEEFDEIRQDDVKVKSLIKIEGNKMTHVQRADKEVTYIREFTAEGMSVIATVNNVSCTRFYKRLS